ncbi:MAG: M1 family aminopeptidase [Calditrichia bacterium]
MEYPTLFLTGNFDGYKNPPAPKEPYPDNNLFLERLTLHELGHQWFYGVCANNEAEEAWLDEGLTEYITAKAFESRYGKIMQLDENGKPLHVRDFRKDRYLANPNVLPSTSKSWEFPTFGDYYIASYVKPKLLFYTLDNILGEAKMQSIIKTFYQRFSFQHPKAEDFFTVVEEVAGKNVREQVVHFLSTQEVYDVGVRTTKTRAEVFGNMPPFFAVEQMMRLPEYHSWMLMNDLTLKKYHPMKSKRVVNIEKGNTFNPKFKQEKPSNESQKPVTKSTLTYFISLDPDSLIEFDVNRANNYLQIEPEEN